jgi:hypothetical protein
MDETFKRFATRCLPMMMANQSGWLILNTQTVRLNWNGGPLPADLDVGYDQYDDGPSGSPLAVSTFGHGIVTWKIPVLFRTPPEFDLLVRGPANWPKPDVYALEGVVEADWAVATFTMNWKIMTPGRPVVFEEAEPICMLVPIRKHDLERMRPMIRSISSSPETERRYAEWKESRTRFIEEREESQWQLDYLRGVTSQGERATHHRTRRHLRDFVEVTP